MEEVPLPTLPDVPGLVFRHYYGRSDIPGVIELLERMRPYDRFDWPVVEQDFIDDFENFSESDPSRDLLMAELDGRIMAYAQVWWAIDPAGIMLYMNSVNVDPELRGTAIGETMLEWCEARNRANSAAHDPSLKKLLNVAIPDEMEYFAGLLKKNDYWIYRHGLKMVRPDLENIPDHQLPGGLEVRDVQPEHHEKIRLAWAEACKDMRGQIPITKEEWDMWSHRPSFDPSLWSMAWHGDEVIGTVFGIIRPDENRDNDRMRGYVEFISTRKDWRGKGVAKALMARTMRLLKERGMSDAGLGVDAGSRTGANHLYLKMGFKVVGSATFYRKEL